MNSKLIPRLWQTVMDFKSKGTVYKSVAISMLNRE